MLYLLKQQFHHVVEVYEYSKSSTIRTTRRSYSGIDMKTDSVIIITSLKLKLKTKHHQQSTKSLEESAKLPRFSSSK